MNSNELWLGLKPERGASARGRLMLPGSPVKLGCAKASYCAACWADVDWAGRILNLGSTKTKAGCSVLCL